MAGYSGSWDDQLVPQGPVGLNPPPLADWFGNIASMSNEYAQRRSAVAGSGIADRARLGGPPEVFAQNPANQLMPPSTLPGALLGAIPSASVPSHVPFSPSGIMPPETPAPSVIPRMPTILMPPSTTPRSAIDLAKEDAMKEWEAYRADLAAGKIPVNDRPSGGFGLSPLFFANHPEVTGGVSVLGDKGPQFLFTENKARNPMSGVNDLVGQLSAKAAEFISSSFKPTGDALYDSKVLNNILTQMPSMMTAQTGAGVAPSQIAQNMANANRPQVIPHVPTGPEGQVGSFLLPPGGQGQPQQFATGTPAMPEKNTITGLVNQGYLEYMKEASKIDSDILMQPEQKTAAHAALQNRFKNYFNGLVSMSQTKTPGSKPDLQTFLREAKKSNPGRTDAELAAYYNQKYGK